MEHCNRFSKSNVPYLILKYLPDKPDMCDFLSKTGKIKILKFSKMTVHESKPKQQILVKVSFIVSLI